MKTLLLILTIVTLALSQGFVLENPAKVAVKQQSTIIKVEEKEFVAYITSKGNYYIIRVSENSGKQYKSYLGYKTESLYDEKPVYSNKLGNKFWFLGLNKNGFPKQIKLKKDSK